MPKPKPISESAVRIHAISVRSAASRLRSFASSLARLGTTGLSVIDELPVRIVPLCSRSCAPLLPVPSRAVREYRPGAGKACAHNTCTTRCLAHTALGFTDGGTKDEEPPLGRSRRRQNRPHGGHNAHGDFRRPSFATR